MPSDPMDGATARSVPGRQRAGNTHLLNQVGSSLVTNAALCRPPKATPAPSVGLHNSLA